MRARGLRLSLASEGAIGDKQRQEREDYLPVLLDEEAGKKKFCANDCHEREGEK